MLSVSVVIRALNEANHLPMLFEGIAAQSRQPDQLILVDSGSTDASVAISEAAGADIVHIAPEEFSFGRALNVGCAQATGDVLVFVSAHVYPADQYWLERLVAPFEAYGDVALVYGRQIGDDNRSAFSEIELMRRCFPVTPNPDQTHPFCNNANCAVRSTAWREVPYDELLTGLEDIAWAKQARKLGYRLWYEPDATIVHLHDETFTQITNRYRREALAQNMIFGRQRLSVLAAVGFFTVNTVRDYLVAAQRRKLMRNLAAIPRFRAAQFLGSWKGSRQDGDPTDTLKGRFWYPNGFPPKLKPQAKSQVQVEESHATSGRSNADAPLKRAGPREELSRFQWGAVVPPHASNARSGT